MPMCFGWNIDRPSPEYLTKLKKQENSSLKKNQVNEEKKEKKMNKYLLKSKKIEENGKEEINLKINKTEEIVKIIMDGEEENKNGNEENIKMMKIDNFEEEIDECKNISPMEEINSKNNSNKFIERKFVKLTVYDNGKFGK